MIIGIAFALSSLTSFLLSFVPGDLDREYDQAAIYVMEIVSEQQQAEQAVEVLGRMRDAFGRTLERAAPLAADFWEVDADFGATQARYATAIEPMTDTWRGATERHIARRVDLASHFTADEWSRFYTAMTEFRNEHPLGI